MSKEPRQIFGHLDRHSVNREISISEIDGDFNFQIGKDVVGSLVFRTPSRDLGVTPEAVIAAVEDHLLAFDPSRGETKLAVDSLEQARKFLAAGRDFAKIVKIELSDGGLKAPKAESKPKSKGPKPVDNSKEK
ncbi:MAG: hypothetical protein E6R03_08325 [Hyphomicrobiaceae bacterium]|nr:MAG: hypothetical protein E6R03_08325 [Hyphomicrobiaceae bacterium]